MRPRLAALAALALLASSCGGGPAAKDAAELVPADATAYVQLRGPRPPQPAAFPFVPQQYVRLDRALPGTLTSLARSEDVAVLPQGAVAFVRPRTTKTFDAMLDARGLLHRRIRGWTVVATTTAPLDAVRHRHATLAEKPGYAKPGGAPLAAYLTRRFGGVGLDVTSTSVTVRYRTTTPSAPLPMTAIPARAVAAVGLTGEPPSSTLPTLRSLSTALGLDLTAFLHALDGPALAYVEPRAPVPLVTVWAEPRRPERAVREVGRLIAKIGEAGISPSGSLTLVDLGPIAILYGLDHGRLVVTDAEDGVAEKRQAVPGLPAGVTRFAYVHGAATTLGELETLLGVRRRTPPSFLLYETQADGVTTRVVSIAAP